MIETDEIELRIGNLKLQKGSPKLNSEGVYHIIHPIPQTEESDKGLVYTVAFIEVGREGCDMRTVGRRPWEMQGTTTKEFMHFCEVAIRLLDELTKED